jgi:hypothetical protein
MSDQACAARCTDDPCFTEEARRMLHEWHVARIHAAFARRLEGDALAILAREDLSLGSRFVVADSYRGAAELSWRRAAFVAMTLVLAGDKGQP